MKPALKLGLLKAAKHLVYAIDILLSPIWALRQPNMFNAIDRVFKLATWLMLIAGLTALEKKSGIPELATATTVLRAIWTLAVFVTAFDVASIYGDNIDKKYPKATTNKFVRWSYVMIFSLAISYWVHVVIAPATDRTFEAVMRAVSS